MTRQALLPCCTFVRRRKRLGLLPRSIRVAVIGYPNVGKSAIINKLIGRKLAKSKNMPGVTKRISWVRLGAAAMGSSRKENELELLDSPGIIPAKQVNQETAFKLAVCNDIGQVTRSHSLPHLSASSYDMHHIDYVGIL